jgi:hypothetical protein
MRVSSRLLSNVERDGLAYAQLSFFAPRARLFREAEQA